jgi:ribosomal protein L29
MPLPEWREGPTQAPLASVFVPAMFMVMTDNVQTAMFDILRKLQEEVAALRRETAAGFARNVELARKHRRDAAGMLVMIKATAGDFSERVDAVEERVAALEARGLA